MADILTSTSELIYRTPPKESDEVLNIETSDHSDTIRDLMQQLRGQILGSGSQDSLSDFRIWGDKGHMSLYYQITHDGQTVDQIDFLLEQSSPEESHDKKTAGIAYRILKQQWGGEVEESNRSDAGTGDEAGMHEKAASSTYTGSLDLRRVSETREIGVGDDTLPLIRNAAADPQTGVSGRGAYPVAISRPAQTIPTPDPRVEALAAELETLQREHDRLQEEHFRYPDLIGTQEQLLERLIDRIKIFERRAQEAETREEGTDERVRNTYQARIRELENEVTQLRTVFDREVANITEYVERTIANGVQTAREERDEATGINLKLAQQLQLQNKELAQARTDLAGMTALQKKYADLKRAHDGTADLRRGNLESRRAVVVVLTEQIESNDVLIRRQIQKVRELEEQLELRDGKITGLHAELETAQARISTFDNAIALATRLQLEAQTALQAELRGPTRTPQLARLVRNPQAENEVLQQSREVIVLEKNAQRDREAKKRTDGEGGGRAAVAKGTGSSANPTGAPLPQTAIVQNLAQAMLRRINAHDQTSQKTAKQALSLLDSPRNGSIVGIRDSTDKDLVQMDMNLLSTTFRNDLLKFGTSIFARTHSESIERDLKNLTSSGKLTINAIEIEQKITQLKAKQKLAKTDDSRRRIQTQITDQQTQLDSCTLKIYLKAKNIAAHLVTLEIIYRHILSKTNTNAYNKNTLSTIEQLLTKTLQHKAQLRDKITSALAEEAPAK